MNASSNTGSPDKSLCANCSRRQGPGMVLTIAPGLCLYVRPAKGVPRQFGHTGIRIEDDARVEATGCELLTRDVPVRADEIEALMRG